MKKLDNIYKKFKGVDAVLLQNSANTFYLTGYQSDFAFILLTKEGHFYFTDRRYAEEAAAACGEGIEIVPITQNNVYQLIAAAVLKIGAKKIGYEESFVTYDNYERMRSSMPDMLLLGIDKTVAEVRSVKTPDEIRLIKKAASINDKAFTRTLKKIKEGVTERQVAYELEYQMKKLGADDMAFKTIVAFGQDTSRPHAHASYKKLECGMPITIDFGCKYSGYCSDITRTFAFGRPDDEFIKIYNAVLNCNIAGIDAVRAGATCKEIDGVCREYLSSLGYGSYFLHGTGHGVGVEIHEAPTLNSSADGILKKNMIVTVEPGVYIEGKYGVRVEDLILVNNDGCNVISGLDKKLLIL